VSNFIIPSGYTNPRTSCLSVAPILFCAYREDSLISVRDGVNDSTAPLNTIIIIVGRPTMSSSMHRSRKSDFQWLASKSIATITLLRSTGATSVRRCAACAGAGVLSLVTAGLGRRLTGAACNVDVPSTTDQGGTYPGVQVSYNKC